MAENEAQMPNSDSATNNVAPLSQTHAAEDEIREVEFKNHKEFLLEIHQRFLNLIDPRDHFGLLDHLREGVIDTDGEEEIVAEKTRRDKARKLWLHLCRISPGDFRDHCYPLLKEHYGHVLERARYVPVDARGDRDVKTCVRHVIRERMTLRRFADVFPDTKGCQLYEYKEITEGSVDDAKWEIAFKLCARNKDNDAFIQKLQAVLNGIKARVPDNFATLLSKGFPCSCHIRKRKIPKCKVCVSSCSTLATPGRPSSNDLSQGTSISSKEPKESEAEEAETHFSTDQHRDEYLMLLRTMNTSIIKASNVRTLSRELAGVGEELSVIVEKMNLETKQMSVFFRDRGRSHNLMTRAREIWSKLQVDVQEIEETAKMAADSALPFKLELLPSKRRKFLLERRHILSNEMSEAFHFFRNSEALFKSIPDNPWL